MKIKLQDVKEDIEDIIDGVLVELIDDDFEVRKVFVDSKNYPYSNGRHLIDVYINKENNEGFKISEIQSKVLTLNDFMRRRYDATVSYQTMDSKSKRQLHGTFPLFKYNQIRKFKIIITFLEETTNIR
jgi:hypothetical protein